LFSHRVQSLILTNPGRVPHFSRLLREVGLLT
jgi:hypothetical protein